MTTDPSTPSVRCSLIVLNYEGEDVIRPCVDSLLTAAGNDDEIIVVDNGSTDASREHLAGYGDRIRVIHLSENKYIFGLNDGLAAARGRVVAFLNNDMTVEPDFVSACVEALDGGGAEVFAVCPRILQLDGRDQGSRTAGHWTHGVLVYESLPHSETATDCFFAVGGQSFFRTDMLRELGSIDPLLWPMYHEDIELSYRAWKRGWTIRYVPRAVAHHAGGHTSKKVFTSVQLRSFVRQNENLTVWKNITDRRMLAEHLMFLLLRLLAAIVRRDRGTLLGFVQALRRLPRALRARREAELSAASDREVIRQVSAIR